jgi:hypothetical protein
MPAAEATVTLPLRTGYREEARKFFDDRLDADLTGLIVYVQAAEMAAATPSFMDEMVKIVLRERHASRLILVGSNEPATVYARSSAERRDVSDKLSIIES